MMSVVNIIITMYMNIIIISSMYLAFDGVCGSAMQRNAVQGDTVVFECSLTEAKPPGDIHWLVEWRDGEILKINARDSGELQDTKLSNRGNYSTTYQPTSYVMRHRHICILTIRNVNVNDQGNFSCVHDDWFNDLGIFFAASLVVTNPSVGSPNCSVIPIDDNTTDVTVGSMVRLTCHFEDEDSNTQISWLKNVHEEIPSDTTTSSRGTIEAIYTLQNKDNGVDFVCKSSATSEKRECRLRPLEILPNVTITPLTLAMLAGNDGNFTCCGDGIPAISRYDWHVNGSVLTDGKRFHISSKQNCSELYIFNITRADNATKVTCEVSVPTGLSASAIADIAVSVEDAYEDSRPSKPTIQDTNTTLQVDTSPQTDLGITLNLGIKEDKSTTISVQNQLTIRSQSNALSSNRIIPICVVVLAITLIAIIALIDLYRRKKKQSKSHRVNPQNCKTAGNDYQPDVPTAISKKQHTHHAFLIPDILYQNTVTYQKHVETDGTNMRSTERNVESLTYAALALNPDVNNDEVLNPSAAEAVVYADVKQL